ncbi:hypothetical protein Syun_014407 [Stephania yunnanensis]|uniref:Uncharacterized protein n=1 Tax=Stephania yunnanensis TaxID=152371 RepID=A0AAP0JLL6_9MAGN
MVPLRCFRFVVFPNRPHWLLPLLNLGSFLCGRLLLRLKRHQFQASDPGSPESVEETRNHISIVLLHTVCVPCGFRSPHSDMHSDGEHGKTSSPRNCDWCHCIDLIYCGFYLFQCDLEYGECGFGARRVLWTWEFQEELGFDEGQEEAQRLGIHGLSSFVYCCTRRVLGIGWAF